MGRLKRRVSINLTPEVLEKARKLGLNISRICEEALKQEIERILGLKGRNGGNLGGEAPGVVARERFELSSAGPEPAMLDRYTTGLHPAPLTPLFWGRVFPRG